MGQIVKIWDKMGQFFKILKIWDNMGIWDTVGGLNLDYLTLET